MYMYIAAQLEKTRPASPGHYTISIFTFFNFWFFFPPLNRFVVFFTGMRVVSYSFREEGGTIKRKYLYN